jgi:hypothetical protein
VALSAPDISAVVTAGVDRGARAGDYFILEAMRRIAGRIATHHIMIWNGRRLRRIYCLPAGLSSPEPASTPIVCAVLACGIVGVLMDEGARVPED